MSDALVLPPVPLVDVDSAPWWESLEGGTLSVARCRACRRWSHPPLERCRTCGGDNALEPVSGQGSIFSFIVVRHLSLPGLVPPYVVAIVELDEQQGLRMSGIVANEPDAIRVGARVTARIEQIGDTGFSAPAFDLTTDASTDGTPRRRSWRSP